jgi:hypothetical protein
LTDAEAAAVMAQLEGLWEIVPLDLKAKLLYTHVSIKDGKMVLSSPKKSRPTRWRSLRRAALL